MQLSGLYFFADNGKETPISGVDPLGVGAVALPQSRVRANGSIIAWSSFDRSDLHRLDMRIQKRIRFSNRVAVDGIVEVFNALNHENYGTFVTNESNAQYGKPTYNDNIAYQPRTMQFGFRTTF